jgi:hypothetical protein
MQQERVADIKGVLVLLLGLGLMVAIGILVTYWDSVKEMMVVFFA